MTTACAVIDCEAPAVQVWGGLPHCAAHLPPGHPMRPAPMAAPPVYLVCGGAAYYLENEDENVLFVAPIDNHGVPRWDEGGNLFEADGAAPYIEVLVALIRAAAVTDRALVALY